MSGGLEACDALAGIAGRPCYACYGATWPDRGGRGGAGAGQRQAPVDRGREDRARADRGPGGPEAQSAQAQPARQSRPAGPGAVYASSSRGTTPGSRRRASVPPRRTGRTCPSLAVHVASRWSFNLKAIVVYPPHKRYQLPFIFLSPARPPASELPSVRDRGGSSPSRLPDVRRVEIQPALGRQTEAGRSSCRQPDRYEVVVQTYGVRTVSLPPPVRFLLAKCEGWLRIRMKKANGAPILPHRIPTGMTFLSRAMAAGTISMARSISSSVV